VQGEGNRDSPWIPEVFLDNGEWPDGTGLQQGEELLAEGGFPRSHGASDDEEFAHGAFSPAGKSLSSRFPEKGKGKKFELL
jgi:hypothetical protein